MGYEKHKKADEVMAMRAKGVHPNEISEKLGITPTLVRAIEMSVQRSKAAPMETFPTGVDTSIVIQPSQTVKPDRGRHPDRVVDHRQGVTSFVGSAGDFRKYLETLTNDGDAKLKDIVEGKADISPSWALYDAEALGHSASQRHRALRDTMPDSYEDYQKGTY